jgi:uncharacterized protein YbaA (DUF1428 family)
MSYVDGFLVPVPKSKTEQYEAMARESGKIWMEFGALSFRECRADDVKPGKWTSFPQAVDLKDDEVVYFSYITYKSRADRDAINEKVMADPRLAALIEGKDLPFDGKRMIFGGFETAVDF